MIKEVLSAAKIDACDTAIRRFESYTRLLLTYNKKMNLTAITNEKDIAVLHYADSLSALKYIHLGAKVIDIGTGAGFPGVPLKIIRPDIDLTLLDALNKRIEFLRVLTGELGLTDVKLIRQRAEDIQDDLRGVFDIVVSRAVARLDKLCAYALTYVKQGGVFIAFKGENPQAELDCARHVIETMGGGVNSVVDIALPFTDIKHSLVLIDKINDTAPVNLKKLLKTLKKSPRAPRLYSP